MYDKIHYKKKKKKTYWGVKTKKKKKKKKWSPQRLNDHFVFPESIRKSVRIIAQIVTLSLEGLQILEGGFLN